MKLIRAASALRSNFSDFFKVIRKTAQPVFFSKKGCDDMAVLSMKAYEDLQPEGELYSKLQEAERETKLTTERDFSKDVLKTMREARRVYSKRQISRLLHSLIRLCVPT